MIYSPKLKAEISFVYGKTSPQFFACKNGDNNLFKFLQEFELYPKQKRKDKSLSKSRQALVETMKRKCYFTCIEEVNAAKQLGTVDDTLEKLTRFQFGKNVKRNYVAQPMEY